MLNNAPTFRAGGTIAPSVFVKVDTTADAQVLQCAAGTDAPIGISQVGMKRIPGVVGSDTTIAANVNDVISVYGLGDVCLLTLGATVVRGAFLKSDANGNGITAVTAGTDEVGARALQSGLVGNQVLVQIVSRKF